MTNIYDHILNLDRSFWDYYSDISGSSLANPFTGNISHNEFISEYFRVSGKPWVLSDATIDISSLRKVSHVTSVFFLGVLVYYNTNLKDMAYEGDNPPGYRIFPFIWFMTSLFHDFAYEYELKESSLEEIESLNSIYQKFEIQHFLLNEKVDGISQGLFGCCPNYFLYRRNSMGKIDHGIFAGVYLYHKLVKIRQRKVLEHNDPRYWGKDLEKQYALASASIAMHNMWFPNNSNKQVYKDYHLETLIKLKPIRLKDYPLLQLLGIIDTMEPIKLYLDQSKGIDETYIFRNLYIDIKPNSMVFSCAMDSKLDIKKMMHQALGLVGWLDVNISCSNNHLRIGFR